MLKDSHPERIFSKAEIIQATTRHILGRAIRLGYPQEMAQEVGGNPGECSQKRQGKRSALLDAAEMSSELS